MITQQDSKIRVRLRIRRRFVLLLDGGLEGDFCLLRMFQPLRSRSKIMLSA